MNNDLALFDFVYDQVVANRKSSEFGIARCCAKMRSFSDLRRRLFDTCNELSRCLTTVFGNVCENLVKIGQRTAFESEFHALR